MLQFTRHIISRIVDSGMFHTKVLLLVFSFLCSALITSGESMGNITSLTRNGLQDGGTCSKVNQLTYGYDGNRLVSVSDAVASPTYNGFFGFYDGADLAVEYEYDANGNMTRDRNKGISSIQYNADNLPLRIQYDNGSRATYLYTADGTKLQVRYETSYAGLLSSGSPSGSASTAIAQTHTIDYVGNKIYEDGTLKKILVDGGYVEYNGGSPVYHAYLTDHQGNVRMVVSESATVKQVNHYYPYGGLIAESTGGDVQRYKYNGKELDRMHGLDWYDHGARHNDAAIGRWHSMDEKCEKYYDVSPYAYCHDNPIMLIDIDGMDDYFDENGFFILRTQYGSSVMIKSGEEYKNITEVDFSENRSVIGNIGRHYLAKSDKGSFSLSVSDTGGEGVPQNAAFSHTVNTNNYDLYLTNGYVNSSLGDYNNFECITYHESIHRYNANAGETTNGEIEAIIETTKCDAWNNATDGYIWSQASYAANKLNQLKGDPGLNNNLKRLNTAFRGYAAFKLLNDKVIVNNQIPSILCTGKLRK